MKLRRVVAGFAVMLVSSALVKGVRTQGVVDISGAPTCSSCRIELVHVGDFGKATDSVLLTRNVRLARDSRGNVFASMIGGADVGRIAVFSPAGDLRRMIGTQGQGPGQFRSVGFLLGGAGDSIYVFDPANGRMTVTSANGTLYRGVQMPIRAASSFALLPHGRFVQYVQTAKAGTSDVFVTDLAGKEMPNFASQRVPESQSAHVRVVVPDDSGAFWLIRLNRYELERWSVTGERTLTIRRATSWFPGWDDVPGTSPYTSPVSTYTRGAFLDAAHRMWIVATLADANFKAAPNAREGATLGVARFLDSYVEVIDLTTRRVLAATRLDPWLNLIPQTDLVYTTTENADGIVTVHLWRLVLRGL
jgi:hypothetical protein